MTSLIEKSQGVSCVCVNTGHIFDKHQSFMKKMMNIDHINFNYKLNATRVLVNAGKPHIVLP
ncbi:hypothetical protein CPA50_00045 [Marinobacter sp. ANT_B65]|nr:hypothetical protein CPA50_00045 [Marinobacter sp. ANT_B65]